MACYKYCYYAGTPSFATILRNMAGFKFNPYNPCIANMMVNGKQHTVQFHVGDDLLSSYVDPKVNDEFFEWWLNKKYRSLKPVTRTNGKIHIYLGMTLNFSKKGKLKIRMDNYIT
jgi:hypothetical protein